MFTLSKDRSKKGKELRMVVVETLQDICAHVSILVGAIGGLNAENCEILKGTGIKGICVVSAIMKQENSYDAAKALKAKIMTICK